MLFIFRWRRPTYELYCVDIAKYVASKVAQYCVTVAQISGTLRNLRDCSILVAPFRHAILRDISPVHIYMDVIV